MFLGEFKHQTDEKHRLRVPAKLKKELGKNFIVTKGTNGCLFLFSQETMKEALTNKIKDVPIFDVAAQKPLRMLLSSASQTEEDKQGRFLLPKNLREFANIKKNVVFVGVGNKIEVWSNENWTKYLQDEKSSFDEVLGGLSKYGI